MDSSPPLETTEYYEETARFSHPEVKDEWVERVLANPHHLITQGKTPGDTMALQISYFADTDTLSLWNGQPASEAEAVDDYLIVDFAADGSVVGITLDHAAKLLGAILSRRADYPAVEAADKPLSTTMVEAVGEPVGD